MFNYGSSLARHYTQLFLGSSSIKLLLLCQSIKITHALFNSSIKNTSFKLFYKNNSLGSSFKQFFFSQQMTFHIVDKTTPKFKSFITNYLFSALLLKFCLFSLHSPQLLYVLISLSAYTSTKDSLFHASSRPHPCKCTLYACP